MSGGVMSGARCGRGGGAARLAQPMVDAHLRLVVPAEADEQAQRHRRVRECDRQLRRRRAAVAIPVGEADLALQHHQADAGEREHEHLHVLAAHRPVVLAHLSLHHQLVDRQRALLLGRRVLPDDGGEPRQLGLRALRRRRRAHLLVVGVGARARRPPVGAAVGAAAPIVERAAPRRRRLLRLEGRRVERSTARSVRGRPSPCAAQSRATRICARGILRSGRCCRRRAGRTSPVSARPCCGGAAPFGGRRAQREPAASRGGGGSPRAGARPELGPPSRAIE